MKQIVAKLAIIYLLTSATIIFEISLSRLFSYMLSFHFVLIIIAFSILGLGIGQIIYANYFKSIEKSLNRWYAMMPLSMLASYLLLIILPKTELFSSANTGLFFFILISIIPFIAIGIIYALLFETSKKYTSLLYGIDLIGAASGALVSVFLLNALSLTTVVGIAILLLLLAAVIHAIKISHVYARPLLISFIVIVSLFWIGLRKLDFNIAIISDPSKDMLRVTANPAIKSKILDSRWNAFGKTDLVQLNYPDGSESKVMFIDGAAGTNLIDIDELIQDSAKMIRELTRFPALFSMDFMESDEKDTALVIGPGGGIDIAASWFMDFDFIEAVEVNPSFVELMNIYNRSTFVEKENIEVYVNEGRNFVQNRKNCYDAILLTIPVTKSGRGADFYGLTENYLFTVEAMSDYLDGLTPEGALILTMHGKHEVYRMLSNYLTLQERNGISAEEALKQVYIVSNGMNPVLLIKKRPIQQEQAKIIHLAAHQVGLDKDIFFFPYVPQVSIDTLIRGNFNYEWYMFDQLLHGISTGKYTSDKLWEASLINLRPVFDNAPYFFNYKHGIPDSLMLPLWLGIGIVAWFLFKWKRGWQLKKSSGQYTVNLRKRFGLLTVLVFLLGFAYFFIQAYMFQILNLKLSSPAESFSLLLFTFLLGNGLGSLLTNRFKKNLTKKLIIYSLTIIGISLITIYLLIPVFDAQLSEIGIAAILLLPSFFIGIPFPILLKMAADFKDRNTIPILLGISSVAGVAASIFAIILSILFGYELVFFAGLLAYVLIILGASKLGRTHVLSRGHTPPNEIEIGIGDQGSSLD